MAIPGQLCWTSCWEWSMGWGIWLLYTSEPDMTHIKHQKKRKGVKAPLVEAGKFLQLKDYIHKPKRKKKSVQPPKFQRLSKWLKKLMAKRFLVYNQHTENKRNSWSWKFIQVGAGPWTSPKQTKNNKSQEMETHKGLGVKPFNKPPGY